MGLNPSIKTPIFLPPRFLILLLSHAYDDISYLILGALAVVEDLLLQSSLFSESVPAAMGLFTNAFVDEKNIVMKTGLFKFSPLTLFFLLEFNDGFFFFLIKI